MSALLHLRNYHRVTVVFKTTLTNWHFINCLKLQCHKFGRLYCSSSLLPSLNGLPENTDGEILHDSSEVQNSVAFGSDADTFGTLKKSLEKVSREERRKKLEGERRKKLESKENESRKNFGSKRVKTMEMLPLTKSRSSMMGKDSDRFGNISDSKPIWCPDLKQEPQKFTDESDNSVIIRPCDEKYKCAKTFLTEMKLLVRENKLKDALDLFLVMKRNFVTPVHGNYTYMIGACGRAGYTEMAFKLLRQMTDMGFRPTPATLTGVFNSCAECPDPEYGLKKANLLKEKIELKNWHLNIH